MKPLMALGAVLAVMLGAVPASASAFWSGNAVFAGFGWSQTNPDTEWTQRAGLQAVELGDRLFVMGGRTPLDPQVVPVPGASTIWSDVWRSRDDGASWKKTAEGQWPARAYFQAVTLRDRMYVIGGQDFSVIPNPGCAAPPGCPPQPSQIPVSQFFNDVWSSRDGASWTREGRASGPGADRWEGRAGLSAVAFKGRLYVFGGSRNDDSAIVGPGGPARVYYNDVWSSSDGRSWTRETEHAPWAPRAGAAAVVKDGFMYLLGGEDGFICTPQTPRCPPYYNDVWRTRNGRDWEQVTAAAAWSPRPGHQCVVVLDRIVCFGGFGFPVNPVDMWSSRDGATWNPLPDAPWNATSPEQVKYDFDALTVRAGGLRPSILTFGGDRETFDFGDPANWLRVDGDVWRYGPRWRWK
ncbi:MAG TPA: hypothetical protein PKD63_07435 [Solirubrobacteraceae bacterium]|nr:hypothetical protein [Solirubrobacteraceae bacterium]